MASGALLCSGPGILAVKARTWNGSPTLGISACRYQMLPARKARANIAPPAKIVAGRNEYKRPAIQGHMLSRVATSNRIGGPKTCHACNPPATKDGIQTAATAPAMASEATIATTLFRQTSAK